MTRTARTPRQPLELVTKLYKVSKDLESILEVFPKDDREFGSGLVFLRRLEELGFFHAFADPHLLEEIVKRLEKEKDSKEALASVLVDCFLSEAQPGSRVFIESGSTLAYFAQALARCAPNERLRSVLTNNFLAQLVFFGRVDVGVTEGQLRKKYLAYLPFRADPTDEDTYAERICFDRLNRSVSEVDAIYLTASTFGFLVGPLVGSRDNAIFKYCLFNNRGRRPLRFCISGTKVFRSDFFQWENSNSNSEIRDERSIKDHIRYCYLIFNVASKHGFSYEKALDARVLTEIGDTLPYHSAPADLALVRSKVGHYLEAQPIVGVHDTWLDFIESQVEGNFELLIACNTVEEAKEIQLASEDANNVLAQIGYSRRYKRAPEMKVKRLTRASSRSDAGLVLRYVVGSEDRS